MNDAKSDDLENKVLRHFLGISSQTFVSTIYLALFTDNPTDADTGTEVTGNGYSRKTIEFDDPTDGTAASSAAVEFDSMPATTVTNWGIYDDGTAGNLMYYGAFNVSKTANLDDTLVVPTAGITITEK